MTYFKNFPLIDYNGISLRNILLKAKIVKNVFKRFDVYYPYTLEDWERPDTIAFDYYGDSKYAWVIYIANDIVDPYYEWVLSTEDLISMIKSKYNMTLDETRNHIIHYRYEGVGEDESIIKRKTWLMPKETFINLPSSERAGWVPVYAYDYEVEQNESRRNIRLLDSNYITTIDTEMKKIFSV